MVQKINQINAVNPLQHEISESHEKQNKKQAETWATIIFVKHALAWNLQAKA